MLIFVKGGKLSGWYTDNGHNKSDMDLVKQLKNENSVSHVGEQSPHKPMDTIKIPRKRKKETKLNIE